MLDELFNVLLVVVGMLAFLVIGVVVGVNNTQLAIRADEVIKECQKSLPRDKVCELIITAEVSDGTND